MSKMICFIVLSYSLLYAQNNQQESQILSWEIAIPANEPTKVIMYDSDSTHSFTLFDNILTQEQKVIFITQPMYFSEKNKYKDEIVLPFPQTQSGLYYIRYSNKDTSYVKKMIFLK